MNNYNSNNNYKINEKNLEGIENRLEDANLELNKIEAYNNLTTDFLERTIANSKEYRKTPLLVLNDICRSANDILILNYSLKEQLEEVKKKLDEILEENILTIRRDAEEQKGH